MSEIETITIKRFPNNPEVPDKVVVEIDEIEMLNWFIQHFELSIKKKKIGFVSTYLLTYLLKKIGVVNLARSSFQEMLAAMKRIAKARILP